MSQILNDNNGYANLSDFHDISNRVFNCYFIYTIDHLLLLLYTVDYLLLFLYTTDYLLLL